MVNKKTIDEKNLLPALIFISITIMVVSCNIPMYIYSPAAHNVPLLTQKGDSKIGAVYSTNAVGQEKKDGVEIDNRSLLYFLKVKEALPLPLL